MQKFLATIQFKVLLLYSVKGANKWRAGSLDHTVLEDRYSISDRTEILLFVTTSTQNTTFCSTPIQLVPGTLFLEVRRAEREHDQRK
jgi:hypothetical protein